jgi:hypothetical protein
MLRALRVSGGAIIAKAGAGLYLRERLRRFYI